MVLPLFVGAILGVGGVQNMFYDGDFSLSDIDTPNATVGIQFNTNGTLSLVGSIGSVTSWWRAAPVTGVGTGKYYKMVYVSGDHANFGFAEDTWHEITSNKSTGLTTSTGEVSGVFKVQLSYDGSTVAAESSNITLTATIL